MNEPAGKGHIEIEKEYRNIYFKNRIIYKKDDEDEVDYFELIFVTKERFGFCVWCTCRELDDRNNFIILENYPNLLCVFIESNAAIDYVVKFDFKDFKPNWIKPKYGVFEGFTVLESEA